MQHLRDIQRPVGPDQHASVGATQGDVLDMQRIWLPLVMHAG